MRLIDADALIIDRIETEMASNEMRLYISKNQIDNAPTVDAVQVKHGRWMKCANHYWEDRYKCSKCGHDTDVDTLMGKTIYTFCPYCGAKMDGERREE